MIKRRYVLVLFVTGLLLALVSLAATMGSNEKRDALNSEHAAADSTSMTYSGDDAYDPAAGGTPERSVLSIAGSYSGDDAYDPAAGGTPERSVVIIAGGYSGDDAYDPAAGGHPE